MVSHPPEFIEPWRLAERGAHLEGELALSGMMRLRPSLVGSEGSASFSMNFSTDEQGCRRVSGTVSAQLTVVCQRCMEPMTVSVESTVRLGLAEDTATAARLPEELEPLVLGREPLALAELIEDELILALPLAPMHERAECSAAALVEASEQAGETSTRDNPFSVLAGLKRDKPDGDD